MMRFPYRRSVDRNASCKELELKKAANLLRPTEFPEGLKVIRVLRLMLAAALVASSGLLLVADTGTAKAAQCLACHFSHDFAGEAEADFRSLIGAVRAPDNEHPGDSKDRTETNLRTSRHSSTAESDPRRTLYGLSALRIERAS